MAKIAVIGAGIAGATTAYELIQNGHNVTLIDRHHYGAMETSFANGGQLSVSNAEVWNRVSTVAHGLGWLFKADAPLSVNLTPSWAKYSWFARFLAEIPNYRKNTIATAQLALEARAELFAIAAREKIDFDHQQRGILHVYRDEKALAHAREVSKLLAEAGLERREVAPSEVSEIDGALPRDLLGAIYTPSDSTGDIHKFTVGLIEAARRRGLNFETGAAVSEIRAEGRRWLLRFGEQQASFDTVVISAGCSSRWLAGKVGDRLPIYPVKGYSITVDLADEASRLAAPWVSLLDDAAKIVTSRLGESRFRVAGTAEFNGYNRDIRHDRVEPLIRWVRELFPGVSTERVTPWAGLRPMMPKMMPAVRPSRKAPGIYFNTGHGHLGWTLSVATASMVAGMIERDLRSAAELRVPVGARLATA